MKIPSYETHPYLTRLEVQILEVGESAGRPWAVLDDTILYPEGGGQPADRGRLGAVAVLDVRREQGEIRHLLDSAVEPGSSILELDWHRRYDHMQQHTAQHLLSALALGQFGWATRSFHIGAETSDIELDAPSLSVAQLDELEQTAMAEVIAGRPVTTRRVSAEEYAELEVRSRGLPAGHRGDIRLVEIEGIDLNTCGGTHLRSTAEIESIKLVDTERLRGGTRVHWVAGRRLRRRLAEHEARNAELRGLFDSDDQSLAEIAGLKLQQLATERRRSRQLQSRLAEAQVDALAAGTDPLATAHFDDADRGLLRSIGSALAERAPARAFLLTANSEKGAFFLLAAGAESRLDLNRLGPRVAEILGGRGGGAGAVFQGKAASLDRRDEAVALLNTERAGD
jgi:Ser-tRNA(Ala) deacylase AlaX